MQKKTRRVRLRVWDILEKKMLYDGSPELWLNHSDRYIPMQSTGGTDKSGKEIYDGDVVFHEELKRMGEVCWIESNCMPCAGFQVYTGSGGSMEHAHYEHLRIVGNIYESPTLKIE